MQSVLDRAIEGYRRERFLRGANEDFAALKRNRKTWKQELRDRELWETTVADGISKECKTPEPLRGDVWDLDLDPIQGHEQAGSRPALILSVDLFNEGPAELVVVVPLTRTQRNIRWHVSVRPTRGRPGGRELHPM